MKTKIGVSILVLFLFLSGCSEEKVLNVDMQPLEENKKEDNFSMFVAWEIAFDEALNPQTVHEESVYVLDEQEQQIPVALEVTKNNQVIQLLPPVEGYQPGENYTLYITQQVQSKEGHTVHQTVTQSFTIHPHQERVEHAKKRSRWTGKMKDAKGNLYTIYLLAIQDEKKVTSPSDAWAGAAPGDVFYNGDFEIGLQSESDETVFLQPIKLTDYPFNKTAQSVFTVNSDTAEQPDFLFVSEKESSVLSRAHVYYIQENSLEQAFVEVNGKQEQFFTYFLPPKSIGQHRFQQMNYANAGSVGYIVLTRIFNPQTGVFQEEGQKHFFRRHYEKGKQIAQRFLKEADYYYETDREKRYASQMDDLRIYQNEALPYSFFYPASWEGKVHFKPDVKKKTLYVEFVANELKQMIFEIQNDTTYEEVPIGDYLGSSGDQFYWLIRSGEPSIEILQPGNEQLLKEAAQMINKDVEIILDSFQFEDES